MKFIMKINLLLTIFVSLFFASEAFATTSTEIDISENSHYLFYTYYVQCEDRGWVVGHSSIAWNIACTTVSARVRHKYTHKLVRKDQTINATDCPVRSVYMVNRNGDLVFHRCIYG